MEDATFKFSNLSKFNEIIHGISTRNYGDMRSGRIPQENIVRNRKAFFYDLGISLDEVVVARLSHKTKIVMVGKEEKGRGSDDPKTAIPATDGLITSNKDVFIMVTVADCLPILIYDPMAQIVAVLHAGWRGIIDQIIPKAIEKLKNLGSEPENLIIGVGPAICQRHFIVKNDVLEQFRDLYPSVTFVRNNDGYVDLKKAVEIDLKKAGVIKTNLEISTDCPSCRNGLYGSHRKEGDTAPAQAAVIGMR